MPDPNDEGAVAARIILRYDAHEASLVLANLIAGKPPQSTLRPEVDDEGAWLIVRDRTGVVVQAIALPDPRQGAESIGEDGAFARAEEPAARVQAVEVAYPGEGATFEVHVGGARTRRGEPEADNLRLREPFEPGPLRRDFNPDLVVHDGPGRENPAAKTLLFLPDGFEKNEMPVFREAIETVTARMLATEPFRSHPGALRIAHVEIASDESGIERHPRRTAFQGHFTIPRVIEVDQMRAAQALEKYCGGRSAAALICANTTEYGGSGGAATVFSRHPDWMAEIAIHELGHGWFGLADEYSDAGQASTMQPIEPNVCGTSDRDRVKWKDLVGPATPLPTMSDLPAGVIGAFEGAKYRKEGVFRPAFDCKMRTPGKPFCAVCAGVIERELQRHL